MPYLTGDALTAELQRLIATPADNNEHLQTIYDLAVASGAKRVVELGVGHGRTTTALYAAMERTGGRLWSCDITNYSGTRAKFDPDRWAYIVWDSLKWGRTWTGPIDLLMIDSSHERLATEGELNLYGRWVRQGGVIVMHDTISHPAVLAAISAWRDPAEWDLELRDNNNGLAILRRKRRRVCRFPFIAGDGLASTSGPTVLMAAMTAALQHDRRFGDITDAGPDDVLWFPFYTHKHQLLEAIAAGRRIAIGPNMIFANSQAAGMGPHEDVICRYENYQAVFTLSRWYSELTRKVMKQQDCHRIIDFIAPGSWLMLPWRATIEHDALIVVKGGAQEQEIAGLLAKRFPSNIVLTYGKFTRDALLDAAKSSRACFYVSREDHYPLAAVEIGLMGCPIISDERSCPVLAHRVNGVVCPVRERGESSPFLWAPDAAERLADEWPGAVTMDRGAIRQATIWRQSAPAAVERIAAALGV